MSYQLNAILRQYSCKQQLAIGFLHHFPLPTYRPALCPLFPEAFQIRSGRSTRANVYRTAMKILLSIAAN